MKLELKHLAAYLPYGLKCIVDSDGAHNFIADKWGLDNRDDRYQFIIYTDGTTYHRKIKNVKPILRPLPDLISEIEHDGMKFVPINELKHLYGFEYMRTYVYKKQGYFNPYAVCLACINKLLEWHFDIYGLIDAGLAIDINKLEKIKHE